MNILIFQFYFSKTLKFSTVLDIQCLDFKKKWHLSNSKITVEERCRNPFLL